MIVEDEEIEAVQIESTRTIDIDQFVPKNEIDERYVDSPYYIAPDGQVGQEAFAVIRDTIAKLNMVALGRVVLARREHVIALEPKGRGLVGTSRSVRGGACTWRNTRPNGHPTNQCAHCWRTRLAAPG